MSNIFRRRAFALALALALALSLTVPVIAAEPAGERKAAADAAIEYAQQYGLAQSIQYALWEDGKITLTGHAGAFSQTENRALTDGDLYGVGSISKVYTTVAVMKLAEAGKVSLDAPVTRYLKDFKMADQRYRDITVRMLLNHSSGLMGTTSANAFLFEDPDEQAADTLLEKLSAQRLRADPGEFSAYCNDGFTLAQLLVEAVSGQAFMDYVRQVILTPAGLQSTFAPQDDFDTGRLARVYAAGDPRALPRETVGIVGAGGMYATASDLAAFGGALTGTKILSIKSTAAMAAPEYDRGIWPDEPLGMVSYGLGWDAVQFWPFQQNGIQTLVKGGDTGQYHAGLVVLPEYNMAAAVLSSGGSSVYNEMAAARILTGALEARGISVDQSIPALPEAKPAAMPKDLTAYSGNYGATAQQLRASVTADGKLVIHQLSMSGVPDQTLSYFSDGSFRDPDSTVRVKLVKESNGSVYLYQNNYVEIPGLGVMPTSDYLLVNMPEHKVSAEAQAAWEDYAAAGVLPLTEKYTSQIYQLMGAAQAQTAAQGDLTAVPGYVRAMQIVSPTELRYTLPIGRDIVEMTVAREGGKTYLYGGGEPYVFEKDLRPLFTGTGNAYATIGPEGYARWFKTGAAAGKTMTVALPKDAGFYVYNSKGVVTASSLLWGDASVELPEDGFVVFAGDPGARFHLQFS